VKAVAKWRRNIRKPQSAKEKKKENNQPKRFISSAVTDYCVTLRLPATGWQTCSVNGAINIGLWRWRDGGGGNDGENGGSIAKIIWYSAMDANQALAFRRLAKAVKLLRHVKRRKLTQ